MNSDKDAAARKQKRDNTINLNNMQSQPAQSNEQ